MNNKEFRQATLLDRKIIKVEKDINSLQGYRDITKKVEDKSHDCTISFGANNYFEANVVRFSKFIKIEIAHKKLYLFQLKEEFQNL